MERDKLIETLNTLRHQRIYYLLSVAAACIGFTIVSTQNNKLDYYLIPAGLAVLIWLLSFICGLCQIRRTEKYFAIHHSYYELQDDNPQITQIEIRDLVNDELSKFGAKQYVKWQRNFLYIGAIVFIYWHIQNLYIHTYIKVPNKVEVKTVG